MFKSSFASSISVCFLGYDPFPSLLLHLHTPPWSSSNKVISILPRVSPVSSCTDHTSWKSLPSMLRYNSLALNHCRKCRKAIVVAFFLRHLHCYQRCSFVIHHLHRWILLGDFFLPLLHFILIRMLLSSFFFLENLYDVILRGKKKF